MNKIKKMFYMMLILSTIMVVSSNNWLTMWIGLEINMMMFIPMMFKPKSKRSSESMMMYFLTQVMASAMFLSSIIMKHIFTSNEITPNLIMTMSMLMKLGMPPFHSWFPKIMTKMTWKECMILMTWQKLAPMIILNNIPSINWIHPTIIIMAATIGGLGGINQMSLQKIMAYSSITHMGWIYLFMMNSNQWTLYLMIYSIMVMMMLMLFNKKNMLYINQTPECLKTNMEKITFSTLILSMGGLPPFLGFLPKWLAIQTTMSTNTIFCTTILILMNLMTLYFYLRMISPIILLNNTILKWNLKSTYTPMTTIMMTTNILTPTLYVLSF